ncbi:MAG: hypothetical protein J5519_06265, partial [Bacteroidales bacterium]|nr:hypothetical protein [Bacteroidales bacterium]
MEGMLISEKSAALLRSNLAGRVPESFCSGLFLSARWMVLSQVAVRGLHLIILPNKEAAEYCSADLYNLVDGDCVFFLPDSGRGVERSNYKSSLGVQRTSALGKILEGGDGKLFIVTYPEAMEEPVPRPSSVQNAVLSIIKGDEYKYSALIDSLYNLGFERVDFVSLPGQFAVRGAVIDIFSYSLDRPYRLTFFGDEVDGIHIFDCNTQLSVEQCDRADIYPDISLGDDADGVSIASLLPESAVIWLDSSDMYKGMDFFAGLQGFRRVYLEVPLLRQNIDAIQFHISPQPVFNKNFELLLADITNNL